MFTSKLSFILQSSYSCWMLEWQLWQLRRGSVAGSPWGLVGPLGRADRPGKVRFNSGAQLHHPLPALYSTIIAIMPLLRVCSELTTIIQTIN